MGTTRKNRVCLNTGSVFGPRDFSFSNIPAFPKPMDLTEFEGYMYAYKYWALPVIMTKKVCVSPIPKKLERLAKICTRSLLTNKSWP